MHSFSGRVDRRRFVVGLSTLAGLAFVSQFPGAVTAAEPKFSANPFTLGIASGDPLPDGVVLWTRLAPDQFNGGGMPPNPFPVQWEVASDSNMQHVVQRGTVLALPELAHSVHVEVVGLEPDRWYWYRFKAGPESSPIGRTRTAPALGTPHGQFRFAFASCQNWQNGFYSAYRNLAHDDLDLVIHLGDYIYEGSIPESGGTRGLALPAHVRPEPTTLEQYRHRYAVYKSDPDLQAAHANFPWIVTWDDHEVENNYADDIPQDGSSSEVFLIRRAAAYQAYYEHQPLRRSAMPTNADLLLYRRFTVGDLMEINVLDTRQYRSNQAECNDEERVNGYCPGALDPSQTMLGAEQKRWLMDGLAHSPARWNILAQQVIFAETERLKESGQRDISGSGDQWDGYAVERQELLGFFGQRRVSNPIVLTGDVHRNYVFDLKETWDDPTSATLGTEFVGTSISSGGDAPTNTVRYGGTPENPHEKFFNDNRGYVRCIVTRDRWQADYRIVETVRDRNASISTLASFVVQNGRPGAERA